MGSNWNLYEIKGHIVKFHIFVFKWAQVKRSLIIQRPNVTNSADQKGKKINPNSSDYNLRTTDSRVAMGILSWFTGSPKPSQSETSKPEMIQMPKSETPAPGMNGAIEVPRPDRATVFEFGSVAATGDRVTLAGYCPVSDDLEPCRWEILPADGKDAPQFRVVF